MFKINNMLKGYKINWDPEDAYLITSSNRFGGCIVVDKNNKVILRLDLDVRKVLQHFDVIEELTDAQVSNIYNIWASPDCVGQKLELSETHSI